MDRRPRLNRFGRPTRFAESRPQKSCVIDELGQSLLKGERRPATKTERDRHAC